MRTNKEKYNYYEKILLSKIDDFIETIEIPENFYGVDSKGNMSEYVPVINNKDLDWNTNIKYTFNDIDFNYVYGVDKPKRDDVKKIKDFVENELFNYNFSLSNIGFWKTKINDDYSKFGKGYSGFNLGLFGKSNNGEKFFIDKNDAIEFSKVAKEKHELVYVVKENQFNCDYCRKATDNNKKVSSVIYSIQGNYRMYFCSNDCAFSKQCSVEG